MKGCRPYSPHELRAHDDAFTGRHRLRNLTFFLLGTRSGFRVSELLSLRIGDVFRNGRIEERVTVARSNMKGKHESRTVLLHPQVTTCLFNWLCELRMRGHMLGSDWLFVRDDGMAPVSRGQMWRIIKAAAAKLKLGGKIGTHSMRKTFADRLYTRLDRDLLRLQKALGHKRIDSTARYLGFREEEIDNAIMEAFEDE